RQQAAAGVGHAQRAVDEHFQFHGRDVLTDIRNLFQGELPGQNEPAHTLLLPELHAGPVDGVGLYRQVNRHVREVSAYQHDQAGVGHDQCIRAHGNDRFQVLEEGLELGVVRRDVHHYVEPLALVLRLTNTGGRVGV